MVTSNRDPARTRERILRSARREFVAKGFAGARVNTIARSAGVNKRMLYHYFGDKEALFRTILREHITASVETIAAAPPDTAELLPFLFTRAAEDTESIRLLQWEALDAGARQVIAEDERRKAWREGSERIRDAQRLGLIHSDLDPELLALSLKALAVFPLAFPQLARLATGARPGDAEFRRRQAQFFRRLGTYLRPRSNPKEKCR